MPSKVLDLLYSSLICFGFRGLLGIPQCSSPGKEVIDPGAARLCEVATVTGLVLLENMVENIGMDRYGTGMCTIRDRGWVNDALTPIFDRSQGASKGNHPQMA